MFNFFNYFRNIRRGVIDALLHLGKLFAIAAAAEDDGVGGHDTGGDQLDAEPGVREDVARGEAGRGHVEVEDVEDDEEEQTGTVLRPGGQNLDQVDEAEHAEGDPLDSAVPIMAVLVGLRVSPHVSEGEHGAHHQQDGDRQLERPKHQRPNLFPIEHFVVAGDGEKITVENKLKTHSLFNENFLI